MRAKPRCRGVGASTFLCSSTPIGFVVSIQIHWISSIRVCIHFASDKSRHTRQPFIARLPSRSNITPTPPSITPDRTDHIYTSCVPYPLILSAKAQLWSSSFSS